MTKAKPLLFALFGVALLLSSCSETKDDPGLYVDWKTRNEAFIDSLATVYDSGLDPKLKAIRSKDDPSIGREMEIYYKVYGNFYTDENTVWDKSYFPKDIEDRLNESPIYTDDVIYMYRGILYTKPDIFDILPIPGMITSGYKSLVTFRQNFYNDIPLNDMALDPDSEAFKKNVKSFTESGFSYMLMNMRPGDRVEVYIPYRYAYGKEANGDIPGYSNLIFDLTLVDFIRK